MMFFIFANILTIKEQDYDPQGFVIYKYLITITNDNNSFVDEFIKEIPESIISDLLVHNYVEYILNKYSYSRIKLIFSSEKTKSKYLPIYEKYIFPLLKSNCIMQVIIKNQTPEKPSGVTLDQIKILPNNDANLLNPNPNNVNELKSNFVPVLNPKINECLNMFNFEQNITNSHSWNTDFKDWTIFVITDFLNLLNLLQDFNNNKDGKLLKNIVTHKDMYIEKINLLSQLVWNDKALLNLFFAAFINQLNSENFTLFIENFKSTFIHFVKIDDDLSLSLFLLCLKEDLNTLKEKKEEKDIFDKIIMLFKMFILEIHHLDGII